MTKVDTQEFKTITASLYADNTTGDIGANDLRTQMDNIADSSAFISEQLTNPSINDDDSNTAGNGTFKAGDIWLNQSSEEAFVCIDASTGVAAWVQITFTNSGVLTASGGPADNELAVWTSATNLEGDSNLTWDGSTFGVTGDVTVSGTVDGRDIATDGTKLDGIADNAIDEITVGTNPVDGTSGTSWGATTITVETGDGITVSNPTSGEVNIRLDNNNITADTSDRTLDETDNFAHVTNAGATSTVRWTVPDDSDLQTGTPRLVTTFFKSADYQMEIIGDNNVTINGVTENGGEESLNVICPTPYNGFAVLVFSGIPQTYYLYESNQLDWSFNEQTGLTYTLSLSDRSKIVTVDNASANTVTIPTNAAIEFPVGTEIRVLQVGAGTTTIQGDTGVTLNGVSSGSGAMTGQWDEVRLYKKASDEWYAVGGIGTVS